ncbi:MAG TPA: HprK-related kinase B [Gammaproteobacteria bacterium]|nr:HprK-related kinase B [Gammaproteobacteria bacterium]
MSDNVDIASLVHTLQGDEKLLDAPLDLDLGGYTMRIRSNNALLLERLGEYFAHLEPGSAKPDIEILAIERGVVDSGLDFIDWAREPGKTGRKDAYFDISGARVVYKVRTGMLFLQSETTLIAAGPCLQYDNQVINYINSQYMNWLQKRGWLICHASALVYQGRGFGIAGFSGGGKSTLMLHLLGQAGMSYLTNDRLFINNEFDSVLARGIPKLPRVNPGTIVHDPNLYSLISDQKREAMLALPAEELWELEDKYDVHVDEVYGPGRIVNEAPLSAFLLLNWQRDSDAKLELKQVDLHQRKDLLGTVMKSPGPFYQYSDGSFHQDTAPFDEQAYLDALNDVAIYEVSGRIDFQQLAEHWLEQFTSLTA